MFLRILILSIVTFFSGCFFAQDSSPQFKAAVLAFENKNFKETVKIMDKEVKVDSLNPYVYILRSDALKELKEYEEALLTLNRGIHILPESSALYTHRGILFESYRIYDKAIDDFDNAIVYAETDSLRYMGYCNRSTSKSKIRDFDGAYADLKKAYDFDSTSLATLVNLGAICDEIGKGNETLFYLKKAIEVDSTFIPAYANIGYKYQEMGMHQLAIYYYNYVLKLSPNEPLGFSNRSYNRYKLGDLKGALDDINKSIKLYPANSYAYRVKALILIEQKKYKKACENLQEALNQGFTTNYGNEVLELQREYCK